MKSPEARRWWALAALVLAIVAIGLDATVLSLALPTLAGSLHASETDLQWFVTAYGLALAASMLPAGLLGDRYGRKTVMVAALVVFGAASIGCALSPSPSAFIAARVVLGMAGAALIVMSLSVVTVLFAEAERPRALGVWAAGNFLSMPLGPIVGGWMLAHVWWGWVFLMNVPVSLVGLLAVLVLIPESRSEHRPGIDLLGVLASSAGLALIMYSLTEAGDYGWSDARATWPALAGLAALAAFILWEAWLTRRPGGEPLIDLSLFRSRSFNAGMVLAAAGVFGMFGVLFTLPQYLQAIMGTDAQGAGLRFLPAIGGVIVGALPADRLAARIGPKVTAAAGFAVLAAGMFAASTLRADSGDGFIAAWTFVVGMGAGLALATAASAAVVELSAERSGVGSALLQAVIKLGPAFGATILGSVLNATYQAQVQVAGLPAAAAAAAQKSVFGGLAVAGELGSPQLAQSARSAFVAGMDDASRLAAVVGLVAAGLALALLPRRHTVAAGAAGTVALSHGEAESLGEASLTGAAAAPGRTMEP
jgi:DHA2 family multidrug resistance protein-like MFS transporter